MAEWCREAPQTRREASTMNRDRYLDLICDAADELPDDLAAELLIKSETLLHAAEARRPGLYRHYRFKPWTAGSYALNLMAISNEQHERGHEWLRLRHDGTA